LLQGGCTFPPVIYYKIFTHRPVTDMCAFSPKDYTAQVRGFAATGSLYR
jgi:hypothetical protein